MDRKSIGAKMMAILIIGLFLQLILVPQPVGQADIMPYKHLASLVRQAEGEIISDEMVLLLVEGKRVYWESAIFSELEATGVWDASSFLGQISNREFAFFVTVGDRNTRLFNSRYSARIADAMDMYYPLKRRFGHFVVHLPDEVVP